MPEQTRKYLPDAVLRSLLEFIQGITAGALNLRRYPKGSEVVQPSLKMIETNYKKLLEELGEITLGESEGKIILNTIPLPESAQRLAYVENLAKALFARNLKSITFKEGLTEDEIVKFLELLGRPPDELKKRGKLSDYLLQLGITHIGMDEKVFIAVKEDEAIVSRTELERILATRKEAGEGQLSAHVSPKIIIAHILEKIAPKQTEFSYANIAEMTQQQFDELLKKSSAMLEKLVSDSASLDTTIQRLAVALEPLLSFKDPQIRKKLADSLTWVLSNFKVFTLAQLVLKKLPAPLEELGIIEHYASLLSPEKRAELVEEIWVQLENKIASMEPSDFEFSFSQLEKAERIINHLASLAKTQKEIQSVKKAIQTTKQVRTLLEKHKGDFGALKVEYISTRPADFFLQPKMAKDILVFLKTLAEKQRADLLVKLSPKLFELARHKDERLTLLGLRGLALTTSLIPTSERPRLLSLFTGLSWQKATNPELAEEIYDLTTKLIAERDEASLDILAGMIPISLNFEITEPDQEAWLESVKERLMKGQEVEKTLKLLKFLGYDIASKAIMKVFIESENRHIRRLMLEKVVEFGADLIKHLEAELDVEHPWYVYRNIVLILAEHGRKPAAFERLLKHPEPRLRRAVYQALIKFEAQEVIQGLKDPDPTIRMMVASHVGTTKRKEAVDDLLEGLANRKRGDDEDLVTAEICTALGKIGDKRAIEPLLKLAVPKRLFSRPQNPKILAAAASALGELRAVEARKILKELTNHSDPKVCQAAKIALEKIEFE